MPTERIEQLLAAIPAAQPPTSHNLDSNDKDAGQDQAGQVLSALERLDEIPGTGRHAAQVTIAEAGLDMSRFRTPGHPASWAKGTRAPSSPGPKADPERPARATATSKESPGTRPPQPPEPTPGYVRLP